ncbi:MAG: hypothetical protein IJK18_06040 [Clostridia bacterium]|nr:hypothetical protein [Clostridia bacterium]
MDYQILNKKFKFNQDKNIGKVLYIVEGATREINLIANIFLNILGYEEVISLNRNGKKKYRQFSKRDNVYSQVVIINSETSNIDTINNTEFIDKQIELLRDSGLDYEYRNSAIYYVFDADRKEDTNIIKELTEHYTNSREPNDDVENKFNSIGGMLLLSYPAIETFIISNFENDMSNFDKRFDFENKKLKEYIDDKKYLNNKMSIDTLSNAFLELINSLEKINVKEINLDNTREFNTDIFNYEQSLNNRYMLSLLLISFVDLGIIEIE